MQAFFKKTSWEASQRTAIVCMLTVGWGLVLSVITRSPGERRTDFFYYFCASKLVAQGHGSHIYDPRSLGLLERSLAYPIQVPGGLIPNVYPPFFAVALAPLSNLPYSFAYIVWLLLNCVLLGLSLAFLERYVGLDRNSGIVFLVAAFLALPVFVALLLGQVSCLLLALLCIALSALRAEARFSHGVALGLMIVKPQYVLPFLLLFAVRRQYRALAAFTVTAAALFLAPVAILGWSANSSYIETLAHATAWGREVGGFSPSANRSFSGFLQLLLDRPLATGASIVLDLIALGGVAVAARRSTLVDVPFGLAVVVALLASQHVLIHDLTLLLIPMTVAWRYRTCAPRGTGVLLVLIYASMFAGFSTSATRSIQIPTIAMSALAAWLFFIAVRASNMGSPSRSTVQAGDPSRVPTAP